MIVSRDCWELIEERVVEEESWLSEDTVEKSDAGRTLARAVCEGEARMSEVAVGAEVGEWGGRSGATEGWRRVSQALRSTWRLE